MFSLIITLVSIALVALLSLASLLYMNGTYGQVRSAARASTVLSQAEQLAGAARIYKQYESGWPTSTNALLAGQYLTSVPSLDQVSWTVLGTTTSTYLLPTAVDLDTCQALNQQARRSRGIYAEAVEALQVQCFGTGAPYSVLVRIDSAAGLGTALDAALPGAVLVAAETDATLSVSP